MSSEDTLAIIRGQIHTKTDGPMADMDGRIVTLELATVAQTALELATVAATRFRAVIVTLPHLTVGANEATVTWDVPFTSTAYGVTVTLEGGPVALGKLTAGLKADSRTETGCVIVVTNSAVLSIPAGVQLHALGWRNGGA